MQALNVSYVPLHSLLIQKTTDKSDLQEVSIGQPVLHRLYIEVDRAGKRFGFAPSKEVSGSRSRGRTGWRWLCLRRRPNRASCLWWVDRTAGVPDDRQHAAPTASLNGVQRGPLARADDEQGVGRCMRCR